MVQVSRRRVPLPEGFLTGTIPPRHPIRELESSDPTRLRRRELLGGEQVEYQGLSIHRLRPSIDSRKTLGVISTIGLFCATSPEAATIGIFPSMAGYYAIFNYSVLNMSNLAMYKYFHKQGSNKLKN